MVRFAREVRNVGCADCVRGAIPMLYLPPWSRRAWPPALLALFLRGGGPDPNGCPPLLRGLCHRRSRRSIEPALLRWCDLRLLSSCLLRLQCSPSRSLRGCDPLPSRRAQPPLGACGLVGGRRGPARLFRHALDGGPAPPLGRGHAPPGSSTHYTLGADAGRCGTGCGYRPVAEHLPDGRDLVVYPGTLGLEALECSGQDQWVEC